MTERIPAALTPNVDTAYTTTNPPRPESTGGRVMSLLLNVLRFFREWACEELNLGPHAYQACALTT